MYDYLLISLLLYDEVSAFPLLVKARNSSFLIGRAIQSFLKCSLLRLLNYMVKFTEIVHKQNATGTRVFLQNKFTDKRISAVGNEFSAEFGIFVLSSLEKYQQFSHSGPWSATCDARGLTFRKINGNSLCFF